MAQIPRQVMMELDGLFSTWASAEASENHHGW